MNQPPIKVSLRPQNSNTSSMAFPTAVQERIGTAQAAPPEEESPRQKFQQYQEQQRSTERGKPAQNQTEAIRAQRSIAPSAGAPQRTESSDFPVSREISQDDQNSEIPSVFGTVKPRRPEARNLHTPLTAADRDADMCTIWLPSNNYFYSFDALSIHTRLKGKHQAKFNKAHKEGSMRFTVEAVTSMLGDGVNAMDLTLEDYYFVMFWLRLVSYTKTQYVHTARCNSARHLEMLEAGTVEEKTLFSTHFVSNTDLTETYFDPAKLEAMEFPELTKAGIVLKPALMRDAVEFSEQITQRYSSIDPETHELTFAPEYEELAYLGNLASFIRSYQGQTTLTLGQRMTVVGDLDADAIDEIMQFATAVSNYGVNETIRVPCSTCGEMIESEVSISAHAFL